LRHNCAAYDTKATPAHGRSSRISRCASSSNDLSAARARSTFSTAELRSASCTLAFAASLSESACDIMLAVAAAAAPPTVVASSAVLAPIVVARPRTSRAVPEVGEPSPPETGRGTPTETTGGEPARAFGFAAAVEPRRGGCALDGVFFRRVRKSWACATFTASTRWRRRAMWRISVRWSVAMIEWVTVPHRSMYPRSSPMCA